MQFTVSNLIENWNNTPYENKSAASELFTYSLLGAIADGPIKIPDEYAKMLLQPWFDAIGADIDDYISSDEPMSELDAAMERVRTHIGNVLK